MYGSAEVEYSEDAERIAFDTGDYAESEVWNVGAMLVGIYPNYYAEGDDFTIYYKTGVSEDACNSDTWHEYTGPFNSLGYVKVRVVK